LRPYVSRVEGFFSEEKQTPLERTELPGEKPTLSRENRALSREALSLERIRLFYVSNTRDVTRHHVKNPMGNYK
jgi:hypothetical protein